jgi:hypothetical protein
MSTGTIHCARRVCVKVLRTASLRSKIEPFANLLVLTAVTFSANIAGTGRYLARWRLSTNITPQVAGGAAAKL